MDKTPKDIQDSLQPQQILDLLKTGNERFRNGDIVLKDVLGKIDATADGQYPLAVVLACIDSRIATEMMFDMGLGDIFSVRIAGNVVGESELGSMEFGCEVAGAKVLLIIGHTRCGAVTTSIDLVASGKTAKEVTGCDHLHWITDEIVDAIEMETETKENRVGSNEAFVSRVAELNVLHTMARILEQSSTLRVRVEDGTLMLAGGIYHVTSGEVTFL